MEFLKVKYDNDKVRSNAPFRRAVEGDAGFDLYNASDSTLTLTPNSSLMIPAGISIKLPDYNCALVHPRSSTFRRRGIFVVPGLIDSGYTGPIFSFVWHPNLDGTCRPILIEPWERLSQLIIVPVPRLVIQEVDELPKTVRGNRGFGSTGT